MDDPISSPVPKKMKKVHKKNCYDPRYSDNWNTPQRAYEAIKPYVEEYVKTHGIQQLVIWDPFFNADAGTSEKYLKEVFPDAVIIHKDVWVDLDNPIIPDFARDVNLIITNPPYSKKNKLTTTKWMKDMELPFMSLMPMETTMLKCMRPLLKDDNLQMIIPNGRLSFENKDGATSSAPLGTAWFCFGMGFDNTMNFLD